MSLGFDLRILAATVVTVLLRRDNVNTSVTATQKASGPTG